MKKFKCCGCLLLPLNYEINIAQEKSKPINENIFKRKVKREIENTSILLDEILKEGRSEVADKREEGFRRGMGGHIEQNTFEKVDEIKEKINKEIRKLEQTIEDILVPIGKMNIEKIKFLAAENEYLKNVKKRAKEINNTIYRENKDALLQSGIKLYEH